MSIFQKKTDMFQTNQFENLVLFAYSMMLQMKNIIVVHKRNKLSSIRHFVLTIFDRFGIEI